MSRGSGIYERAILATLMAPWKKAEKCRCVRCIERKAFDRIMDGKAWWRLRYSANSDDFRRSYRRAFNSLMKKGVISVCPYCRTVQMWDDPRRHKDGHGAPA